MFPSRMYIRSKIRHSDSLVDKIASVMFILFGVYKTLRKLLVGAS